jgi:hypothetical protein
MKTWIIYYSLRDSAKRFTATVQAMDELGAQAAWLGQMGRAFSSLVKNVDVKEK